MTELRRDPDAEAEYHGHLTRSVTVWDRWSRWYTLSERDFEPTRRALIGHLDIQEGDRVLDVGCGPGVNLALLRDAVGSSGEVTAIDYSPAIVAKARERITDHPWENVLVERADATTATLGGPYDAVTATLSLSLMPDIPRVVASIRDALRPGGSLGVLDIRLVPSGPTRVFNPALARFLRWYANWQDGTAVIDAIETEFPEYRILGSGGWGTIHWGIATRTDGQ